MAVDPVPDRVDDAAEDVGSPTSSPPRGGHHVADRPEHLNDCCAEEFLLAREVVVHRRHTTSASSATSLMEALTNPLRANCLIAACRRCRCDATAGVPEGLVGRSGWARAPSWPHPTVMTPRSLSIRSPIVSQIDTTATPRRPAHRPSRRHVVVDGAMGSVRHDPRRRGDRAGHCDRGRDDPCRRVLPLRLEGADPDRGNPDQQFANQLLEEIRTQSPQPGDTGGLGAMITHVLAWTVRRRAHATVYFVNSIGLNLVVEAVRRGSV